jgi:hydroxymethylpyrimidine pyrophosphatase-like HAD family hydrolase
MIDNKPVYCFDVDDTILFSEIDDAGEYNLTGKNERLIFEINRLYDNGCTIIIYTGRHWNHLQITIDQLQKVGVKYHTVVCGKPVADIYIDDRAVTPWEFLGD